MSSGKALGYCETALAELQTSSGYAAARRDNKEPIKWMATHAYKCEQAIIAAMSELTAAGSGQTQVGAT